jgi:hypothetical protein
MSGTTGQVAVENGVVEFRYNSFLGDMNKYFQLQDEIHTLQGLLILLINQHVELLLDNVKANKYEN